MMKKMALLAIIAMASSGGAYAAATVVCDGTAEAHAGTEVPSTADGSLFVVTGFTPQCSANSHVSYDQNQTAFWVGSASAKGKSIFGGSSDGGGVRRLADCANTTTGCTATDAETGLTTVAPAASGGSGT